MARLEKEYGFLLQSVKEPREYAIRSIEAVIEEDVQRSRETIAKNVEKETGQTP